MINSSFKNVDFLKKAMDGSWLKNKAIANNIANVNTPGYKREVVNFEDVLKNELNMTTGTKINKTNSTHMDNYNGYTPTIEKVKNTSFRKDENNVNIDIEMAEYSKNTIHFQFLTKQLNSQFSRIRSAIKDGR